MAIAIAALKRKIEDIKEEIELCNRYSLLHNLPPVWYLGVFSCQILVSNFEKCLLLQIKTNRLTTIISNGDRDRRTQKKNRGY